MSNPTSDPTIYTVGGTVQVNEWGVYIPRQADGQLLDLCQQGTFAYVLTPRQMGKSSLMIRTAEQLIEAGSLAVIVDLTQIGTQVTADEWYSDFLSLVADQLMLSTDAKAWWQAHSDMGITLRMTRFFKEVVLTEVSEPIAIFVDEIDTTLSLDFTDDFYAAVRFLYVARSTDAALKRLSFVLIGVATPSDLIRDPKRTPFNIGQRVELTDFTADEAAPLGTGLGLEPGLTQQVMGWILAWTQGHPYLTQRLCRALLEQPPESWTEVAVAQGVSNTFFGPMSEQDNNLQFVGDMLTKRAPELLEREVLDVYRQVHRDRVPVWDEEQSLVKSHLKLAGIVWRDGRQLVVRNPIYREVFNQDWIKDHWPETLWQRLKPAMPLVAGLTLVAMGLGTLSVYALDQRNEARTQTDIATQALERAQDAQLEAEAQAAAADDARKEADDERAATEEAKLDADEQRDIAQQKTQEAEAALADAQAAQAAEAEQRRRAEEGEAEASRQAEIARQLTSIAQNNAIAAQVATRNAEIEAINAEIRADNLAAEKLIVSGLDFEALLAATHLGRQVKSDEIDNIIRPEIRFQTIAILREAYNLGGYRQRNTLDGHEANVSSVSFAPNGQMIASADGGGTVKIWDLQGREVKSIPGHTDEVNDVSFSPDGKIIASASSDGTVKVWDLEGQELDFIEGPKGLQVSFSPDGQIIAIASTSNSVTLWDLRNDQLRTLVGHTDFIKDVSFSPDGQTVASASNDGTIKLWSLQGHELQTIQSPWGEFQSVSFSPVLVETSQGFEYLLVSTGNDLTVRLWDVHGNELGVFRGHTSLVWDANFSSDGRTIISGSLDGSIKVWDLQGNAIQTLKGHTGWVESVRFSPDDQVIASASSDGTVKLWHLHHGEQQIFQGHNGRINSIQLSPDGQTIASASDDGLVKLWDLWGNEVQTLEGHTAWVRSVDFSPDGKTIVSASDDGTVRLWDLQGNQLEILGSHTTAIRSVEFSPNGEAIASSGGEGKIKLWDLQSNTVQTLQHSGWVMDVSFSPDNQIIASSSSDGTVHLWNLQGELIQTLKGHGATVRSAAFSPDGQMIVSASVDGTVKTWNLQGDNLLTLKGHAFWVLSATFSPDGRIIASTGADHTVRLWDLRGNQLPTLQGHWNRVNSASFSRDGQTLVSAGDDRNIILWNFNLDDLLDKSCAWLRNYIANPATPTEHKALCPSESGVSPLSQLQGAGIAQSFLKQLLTHNS